ncbi:MAG: glycoside hydrolase family 19 protein [Rhodoferax sp.]|nr:glycoside hydrolase family 19 protein [Rhodoferax sp.]
MVIARSVGIAGRNDLTDVLVVQLLFNMNLPQFSAPVPKKLDTDGRIGSKTLKAIEAFETRVMGLPESDQMVAPGDATIKALLKGLPKGPSPEKLQLVMPRALASKVKLYYEPLVAGMTRYKITTDLRMAHFIAQLAHESASFRYTEELASGDAYEGRTDLGNTQSGDGRRFKGRGLIQLTGRANYAEYSKAAGTDYVAKPQLLASDPFAAVDVACWFWHTRKLNALADADDVKAVTRRINGGYNGLDDRIEYLTRAKAVLGLR